jgi:hypothetical protein
MYTVKKCFTPPALSAAWDSPDWSRAEVLSIAMPIVGVAAYKHNPQVACRLLHDDHHIYGLFQVHDRYVRCVTTKHNEQVCRDSCVEFFVEPPGGKGYFNFEFSGNGTTLLYHIREASLEKGISNFSPVSEEDVSDLEIFHTLPAIVDPPTDTPITWRLGFKIPLALFARQTGTMPDFTQKWHANFYKCGGSTEYKHWLTWQPLTVCNFHQPDKFGKLTFEV